MAIELIVDTPVLKGEKGDKGDTGSFDYTYLEEIVDEHLDNRFENVDASLLLKVDKEEGKSLVDDEYIQKLENIETLDVTIMEKFAQKIDQSDLEENLMEIRGEVQNYIDEKLIIAGSGDMLKSIYDTDGDGVIDIARSADNANMVNNLSVESAVPINAVFTDTTYEEATTSSSGLMSKNDKIKLNGIESGANYVEVLDDITSDIAKALSVNQGKIIKEKVALIEQNVLDNNTNIESIQGDVDKLKSAPTLLFSGAVRSGTLNLSENIENFKSFFVAIGQTTSSSGASLHYTSQMGVMADYTSRRFRLGVVINVANSSDEIISQRTIAGAIEFISGESIEITAPFVYIAHSPNSNHSALSEEHYIREIWGVR